jgi:hypothetical protein
LNIDYNDMNATTNNGAKTEYLLLVRGEDWDKGLSAEHLQEAMGKAMAWFDGLHKTGRIKAGQPLGPEGKVVTGKAGVVSDGPFAEAKEVVGGYLVLQVADEAEAVAIARSNPMLELGMTIEVRPVLQECPVFQRARQKLNLGGLACSMS